MSDLPPGWEWATLGDIAASLKNGIFVSRPGTDPDGVPILRISAVRPMRLDVQDVRYTNLSVAEIVGRDARLDPGDLLFTRYSGNPDFVGSCAHVPEGITPLTYPDKLIRVRVSGLESKYIAAAFASPSVRDAVRGVLRTTAGQVGISGSALAGVRVPLPPLLEQARIVETLESHLSRIEVFNCAQSSASQRMVHLRHSALVAARHDALQSGASLLPIAEIADTQLGKMLDARRSSGIRTAYLRNINVRWGQIDVDDVQEVALTEDERAKFSLRPGDVLVCEGGEPGRCAVWTGQLSGVAFQKALHRIRVRQRVSPEWLCMMLEAEVRGGRTEHLLTGSTIKHLPQQKLRTIQLPVPSLQVQEALVRRFRAVEDSLKRATSQSAALAARAAALRRSLLADAFAGRLVPQDPTDEPASVLLERIRAERAAAPKPKRARRGPRPDPAQETLS